LAYPFSNLWILDVFQLIFMGSASSLDICLGIIRYWLAPVTAVKPESVEVVTGGAATTNNANHRRGGDGVVEEVGGSIGEGSGGSGSNGELLPEDGRAGEGVPEDGRDGMGRKGGQVRGRQVGGRGGREQHNLQVEANALHDFGPDISVPIPSLTETPRVHSRGWGAGFFPSQWVNSTPLLSYHNWTILRHAKSRIQESDCCSNEDSSE